MFFEIPDFFALKYAVFYFFNLGKIFGKMDKSTDKLK